jgi:hypothetical protein
MENEEERGDTIRGKRVKRIYKTNTKYGRERDGWLKTLYLCILVIEEMSLIHYCIYNLNNNMKAINVYIECNLFSLC